MSAPNLSRALVLQSPVATPDGAGGFTTTWHSLGTHWAAIDARTGQERFGALGPSGQVALRITLRAAPFGSDRRPRPDQRFVEGQRIYRILTVAEADSQGRYLICTATEELPA
ncbi:MAG: gene transfer agenet head-tail adaptor protein [Roseibaca calidilacus]|uniref:Head-tail adaptor n=1 Tax=Roseibaca calidilacus TaxID=1666912 RepID=A0A0P8AMI0_9RHOB|nr:head-tail adaptor protein [Roseibaca calidilacus]KPP95893.1 MAG: gene transfer agenet head-tail adaptor protein [Roseibaca calidilacus]CUX81537.1 head-tail adaptor [Roseibaca calidilacus]